MQRSMNLMIFCFLAGWHGVLGNGGCSDEMWMLLPKFLNDLIVQMLFRSTVIIVYEGYHEDNVNQVITELHRNSLTLVVLSIAQDSLHNSSSNNLLQVLKDLSFNKQTLIYPLCVCFTPETINLFLQSPVMQRHLSGRILDAQGDFSPSERWIFIGSYLKRHMFIDFSYRVASVNIKKMPNRTSIISILGSHFYADVHRKTRVLAKWNIAGFQMPLHSGLMDDVDKRSLMGQRIRVAYLDVFPFFSSKKSKVESRTKDFHINGIEYELVTTLAACYGLQLNFILAPDEEWGHIENNTWRGLVGMLHRHEAELALTSLSQTFERMGVADFSYPHVFDPVTFITKAPDMPPRAFLIFRPFQLEVTCTIVMTAFCTACVIYTISLLYSYFGAEKPKWDFTRSLSFVMNSLTLRGDGAKPSEEVGLRILIICWWLVAFVVMSSYSGILISSLNVPKSEGAIDAIEALNTAIQKNKLLPSTLRSSSVTQSFMDAEGGVLFNVGQKLRQNPQLLTTSVLSGLKLALQSKIAFIFPRDVLAGQAVRLGSEKFHLSSDGFYDSTYSIGMTKGSPLQLLFAPAVMRLSESGIINRWSSIALMRKSLLVESEPSSSSTNSVKLLTWEEMKGILIVLGIGYALSIVTLLLEKIVALRKRRA